MYEYKAFVTRVVDGDTFDAEVQLGFGVMIRQRFRLFGVNAPEVRGDEREEGRLVKKFLQDAIEGHEVIVRTFKNKQDKDKQEKYGRYLADVRFPEDPMTISQKMLTMKLVEKVDY